MIPFAGAARIRLIALGNGPRHAIGLRPWIPKWQLEGYSCAIEHYPPLTPTPPCEETPHGAKAAERISRKVQQFAPILAIITMRCGCTREFPYATATCTPGFKIDNELRSSSITSPLSPIPIN
jgi:hypothetical protein